MQDLPHNFPGEFALSQASNSMSNMDASTTPEKIQPWKAQWLAKLEANVSASGDKGKAVREGTSHGFSKGQEVILDGTTTGMASRLLRKDNN
ncbi:hypothetical protein MMC25_001071 [Agyrium rufum]|nr:hypothetical protein [Agyrium rufum]